MGFFSNLLSGKTTTSSKVSTKTTSAASTGAKISGLASTIAKSVKTKDSVKKNNNNNNNNKKGGGTTSTTPTASTGATVKADALLQWHDVSFYANAQEVRGLIDFSISGSVETEDKESGGTKYVNKKNSKGYEASITAFFDKRLGIGDVKYEAMKLVDYGANGQKGYLYARGSKLVTSTLMLTSAKASKIVMTPNGTWISCQVALTLKMADKLGSSANTSSTGGNSGGGRYYKVRIEGMSELKVWATSENQAVQKACGSTYSGYVYVDNKNHYANKGKIDDAYYDPKKNNQNKDKITPKVNTAATQQKEAKTTSTGTGITNRNNQVQQKKLLTIMTKDVR